MKKLSFQPTGSNILVKKLEGKKKTESGIILPENSNKDVPYQAAVVAVGKGNYNADGSRRKPDAAVGDTVLVEAYTGTVVVLNDGEEYVLVAETSILGIV